MNMLQRMMLEKTAKQFIDKGVYRVLIDWEHNPDDDEFMRVVVPTETIVDKTEYEFLKNFYITNKTH